MDFLWGILAIILSLGLVVAVVVVAIWVIQMTFSDDWTKK